ncbi:MAG TPA: hypothetical protein VJ385_07850 [Fibrobacteria bacterium]|nr:hypothetical protein [Fibrobacteria bacterium]
MPLTFLLLQLTNAALAAATLWIHFRNPFMWDDQALLIATCAGVLGASLTAVLLGISLVFRDDSKWAAILVNLLLTLAFAGLQGYFLFLTGRDLGLIQLLKSKLG